MGALDPREVTTNRFLSDVVIARRTPGLVVPALRTVVGVPHQSGTVGVFQDDFWHRAGVTASQPGESPKTSLTTLTTTSYSCRRYSWGATVADETVDNSDIPSVLARQTEAAIDRLNIDFEVRVRDLVYSNAGSSMVLSGASALSAQTSSCPTSYFYVARQAIQARTGLVPNTMLVSRPAFDSLATHPDIVRHSLGNDTVSRLEGITQCRVLVADARILANDENQPLTYSNVWSSSIIFCVVANPNPNGLLTSYLAAYRWGGPGSKFDGGGPPAPFVKASREPESGRTTVFTRLYQDEKVLNANLSFLIATGL